MNVRGRKKVRGRLNKVNVRWGFRKGLWKEQSVLTFLEGEEERKKGKKRVYRLLVRDNDSLILKFEKGVFI